MYKLTWSSMIEYYVCVLLAFIKYNKSDQIILLIIHIKYILANGRCFESWVKYNHN